MDNILEVIGVSKHYTGHKALDDVSISIAPGTVYGLLGPNGAGKTTLIRIINHITAPDSGTVMFDGHTLTADDVSQIGYLPEERGLYKKMKVGEQAIFFARLKGLSKADATTQLKRWFDKFGISDWWDKKIEELSKGMAQKVQFIVTVLHRPKLLIFDEPFSGFDPINANLLKQEILQLRDEGSTIIFSTHNMGSVEEICSDITLINKGKNILTGNVDELRHRFSDGRCSLTFTGDPRLLMERLQPMSSEFFLDEPTNDLDIMTLGILEEYLAEFKGCLIVISHDRFFLDSIVDHLFVLDGTGEVYDFPGNYTEWRAWEDERQRDTEASSKQSASEPVREKQRSEPERQKLTFKERREFESLEAELEDLNDEKSQLEALFNSGASSEEIASASVRYQAVMQALDEKEMRWLELSEKA